MNLWFWKSYIFSKTTRSRFVLGWGKAAESWRHQMLEKIHSQCGICPEDIFVLAQSGITLGRFNGHVLKKLYNYLINVSNLFITRFKVSHEIFSNELLAEVICSEIYIFLEFFTRRCYCSWNSGEFWEGHSLLPEWKIVLFHSAFFVMIFCSIVYSFTV